MGNDTTRKLCESFCDVIQRLAFMYGEVVPKDQLPQKCSEYIKIGNSFTGSLTGCIIMTFPQDICPEIVSNILGMDPGDERVHRLTIDALKELLNVTSGNILSTIAGKNAPVEISIPSISRLDPEGWKSLRDDPATVGFLVDGHPVLIWVWYKE